MEATLRCQINVFYTRLLLFGFFPTPRPYKDPHLVILRKLTLFTYLSFHFFSLLVLFCAQFLWQNSMFLYYFSFMRYANLFFCSFRPCISIVKSLLILRPPVHFNPLFIAIQNSFEQQFLLAPLHSFGT